MINLRNNPDGSCNCRPLAGGCFFTDGFEGKCDCKCHMTTPNTTWQEEIEGTELNSILMEYVREMSEKDHEPLIRRAIRHNYARQIKSIFTQELQQARTEGFKELLSKHNALILNEFQLQGKPDMPIIAYDERVCLIPAMKIATEETLASLITPTN